MDGGSGLDAAKGGGGVIDALKFLAMVTAGGAGFYIGMIALAQHLDNRIANRKPNRRATRTMVKLVVVNGGMR